MLLKNICLTFELVCKKVRKILLSQESYAEFLRKQGVCIGENCDIDKSANFGSEPWLITIGNNVRVTQRVQFITHDGGLWTLRKMGLVGVNEVKYENIYIGDNCNISWDVIIMPNVHIGNNVIVAAGAVVTKNIPDGEIWGGIPAKKIETIDEYLRKIKGDTVPTFNMSNKSKIDYLKEHRPDLFR